MKFTAFNRREVRRFVKFSIVGAIGFVIDTGVCVLYQKPHLLLLR